MTVTALHGGLSTPIDQGRRHGQLHTRAACGVSSRNMKTSDLHGHRRRLTTEQQ